MVCGLLKREEVAKAEVKDKATEKEAALQAAKDEINKQFGKGAIMNLGDSEAMEVAVIPTGSLTLDLALSGGLARGRIVELYGNEGSGKSTIALHAIAEAQKLGGICAYVDAEHALDPVYAAAIGVDIKSLQISQPGSAEEALTIVDILAGSGVVDIVVIDSVAALTPRAEIEGDYGDSHMGLQARLMGQAMRKLNGKLSDSNTIAIFINQIRMKIGIVFGNPETTPGGKALGFFASTRLEVRKAAPIKHGDEIVGQGTKVKVAKHKTGVPFRVAEFDIMYGEGISQAGCILDQAVTVGIVTKAGNWFAYDGKNLGNGREASKTALQDNPALMEHLYKLVMEHHGI